MVGGHQSVAKGVGERAEQPEGLYLGRETAGMSIMVEMSSIKK
jgi:hypothetical protein